MTKKPNLTELLDTRKVTNKDIQQQMALNSARKRMKESKASYILTITSSVILIFLVAGFYFVNHLEIYVVLIGEVVALIFVIIFIRSSYRDYQKKKEEYAKALAMNQIGDEINQAVKQLKPIYPEGEYGPPILGNKR